MSNTMELSHETLETIGRYVRGNLKAWMNDVLPTGYTERDVELRERALRVEVELKAQREIISQNCETMRMGFEQVDKRFEQVDKRLDDMNRHMNRWLTVITVMLGLIGLAMMVSNFVA